MLCYVSDIEWNWAEYRGGGNLPRWTVIDVPISPVVITRDGTLYDPDFEYVFQTLLTKYKQKPLNFSIHSFEENVPEEHVLKAMKRSDQQTALDGCSVRRGETCEHGYQSWIAHLGIV